MKEIAACDIDQTLILHDCDLVLAKNLECETVTVKSPYTNEEQTYVVNEKHVELVKNYQARGFTVLLWSNNGESWARAVGLALNLQDCMYMAKPIKMIDDQQPEDFLPKPIYLNCKYQQFCLDNNMKQ